MHQFFQQGQQVQQQTQNTTPELQNNEIVLEIINNWEYVRELFFKMMSGELKAVDQIETTWVSFINSKMIDMKNYKTPEEFEEKYMQSFAENKD